MNELLTAAKAVIADWDDRQVVGDRNLRAAVERAEEPVADFDKWVFEQDVDNCGKIGLMELAWQAAKQAERERIRDIIKAVAVQGNSDAWFDACDTIMEKIDAPT